MALTEASVWADRINYERLPEHIRAGVRRYIEEGIKPGHFLSAVISNDLKESFARADDINIVRMFDIVNFFYNEAPYACWGSTENMTHWLEKRGLKGNDHRKSDGGTQEENQGVAGPE